MPPHINGREKAIAAISAKWGWFATLGVGMIASSMTAWLNVGTVIAPAMILVGASPLVGGAFQIIHGFLTKEWHGFAVSLSCGVLYLISGISIMNEPMQGALALTVLAGVSFVVSGIMRIHFALEHRNMSAWWIVLLSGVVSIVVGCLLYLTLPWSGLWVLGILIAVELFAQGVSWVCFGVMLRSAHHAEVKS